MEAFVYCWTDIKTNKLYVGVYKGAADDGYVCSSKYMMEEYNNRTQDFSRQIIADGEYTMMRKLESKILQSINAAKDDNFYNMHNNNGAYILKSHTEETKRKISESEKGKIVSEKSKLKMRLSKMGEKNNRYGTKHTEETKKKMSESAIGRLFSDAHRKNLSKAKKGKNWFHNPETKKSKLFKFGEQPLGWILGRN